MTRHTTTIIALLIAGALSMVLFSVKYQVQELENEIVQLNSSTISDEQAIHVLKAEWSYLNDPKRLKKLSARYLGLKPIEPEQIVSVANLPKKAPLNHQGGPSQQAQKTPPSQDNVTGKSDDFFQQISSALAQLR